MDSQNHVLDFLADLRDEVCSRCGGRPAGDPRGNPCGQTLPLDQLVAAIRAAQGGEAPGPGADWCPCTIEKLAALAREAAESLEKERQQRDHLLDLWDD
jgi:hypothetical protein